MQMRGKGRKVANHCVFPMICGSGGSKSRLAKAAEPSCQMRDEKVHAVVARSTFRSQNVQSTPAPDHFWKLRCRKSARRCGAKHISKSKCTKHTSVGPLLEIFGSWDVEKVHAVVVRSTFRSQNVPVSDHFWKLRCRKSARRCGAKHISKSKCTKHTSVGPLLEIFGSWDVEKVHAVVVRSTFRSQNVQNTPVSDHFWKLRCRKSARRCGAMHISKSKCTKHHMLVPLLEVQMLFRVAGARDCAPCQKWAKRDGFVAFPKTMAGVGHLKRICQDAFRVAGAVQKTCSWEMLGGQGADFLRGGAFWSIRSVGLLRWFCVTGAALRTTWHQFFVAGAIL